MIAGVDEAGKGAVLGPLVVAAVAVDSWAEVAELGRRDSKALTPRRREALFHEIISAFPFSVVECSADMIDRSRAVETMNEIVAGAHASALDRLADDGHTIEVAYIDACDVREGRYAVKVARRRRSNGTVAACHHADEAIPVVAVASIVAKVNRDRAIAELSDEFGPIGSGYPSDPSTRRFIDDLFLRGEAMPRIVRSSWRTVSIRRIAAGQQTLF
jgi:ribonuclease HII